MIHKPVLLKEVIEYFNPKSGQKFIDATLNGGGHSKAIAENIIPDGKLLGIELDPEIYKKALESFDADKFKNIITIINDSYVNISKIVEDEGFSKSDGIIFDLGMSSHHVDSSKKGFTFNRSEPLDMRYSNSGVTASDVLNQYSEENLIFIIKEYGGEKFAKRIAKGIIEFRKEKKFKNTDDLIEVIREAIPVKFTKGKIHFATKTFQAIRIEVNKEIQNIKSGIIQAINLIKSGGKIIVISFHSEEDRIIKNQFKKWEEDGVGKRLTKKPLTPSDDEIRENPRSRSAKLRVFLRLR